MTNARITTPTGSFSKSYLTKAWRARSELHDAERRGLVQFVYLAICAHVEEVIAAAISVRAAFIRQQIMWSALPPVVVQEEDKQVAHTVTPLAESAIRMAQALADDVETAPLSRLIQLYNRTFPATFRAVVGAELDEDIGALANLRNLLAHGRHLSIEFTGDVRIGLVGTLDGSPIQSVAKRLHRAGIVKNFEIDTRNHSEWVAALFSDAAVMYFHAAAQSLDKMLWAGNAFPPERAWVHYSELPPLDGGE